MRDWHTYDTCCTRSQQYSPFCQPTLSKARLHSGGILNVLGWMECKSHGTTKGYWVGNVNYSNESLELQRWHDLISSDPFRDGRTLFFLDQPLCINHKMTNCPVGRTICSRRNSLQREPYQVYRLRDAPRDIGVIYMYAMVYTLWAWDILWVPPWNI